MKNSNYSGGSMRVSHSRSGNRYITSSIIDDRRASAIAVISAIMLLAVISCVFFLAFADDFTLPTWDEIFTTSSRQQGIKDPNKSYPYATNTSKTQFVASNGGTNLSSLGLYSQYAILISVDDMTTIGYKNADEKIYPASMTKVMTVITALDYIENLDEVYIATPEVLKTIPSGSSTASMKYVLDEYEINQFTIRDLLYGISYRSGADSVMCLLDHLGLTVSEFASLMNEKAKEIGLKNTHFGGAIGMDSEENQTTCRDMAAIMAYAMENEYAREFFSGLSHHYDRYGSEYTYYHSTLANTVVQMDYSADTLLRGYTLIAAKSGLEDNAGYCLVSYIENDETGEKYVLVTAKAERAEWPSAANPINDMMTVFNGLKP